jgi:hypothetical protein
MTIIPESGVLNETVKVLRPLNPVKLDQINYHQIIKVYETPKSFLPINEKVKQSHNTIS